VAAPQHPQGVVLVGFMGAGKSAVGRELAGRLGLEYLDTDVVIAATAGPIPAIFASGGERGFRTVEAETVLREVAALRDFPKVLALGGGAVLTDDVRAALRPLTWVVWLTAPADELWRRVTTDAGAERPLARDEAAFRTLLAGREPLYRDVATLTVDTTRRSPGEVAEGLAAKMRDEAARLAGAHGTPREGAA
jgi:shikimate kinase